MNSVHAMKAKKPEIMLVDDVAENLRILTDMLAEKGYTVRPVLSGKQAIGMARNDPPDLILLDITMPEMSGYEVCAALKSLPVLQDIPVIFISALTEAEDKVKAFEAGGVDYVTKPFKSNEVQARVATHLRLRFLHKELENHNVRLSEMVQAQVKEISESQMATIFALAKLAESRDDETGRHLERVRHYCGMVATWLSKNSAYADTISSQFIQNIFTTSPLHDIGKVGISDGILLKPGKLTSEEFEIMKKHAIIGADTLAAVGLQYPQNNFVKMGIEIARQHHEKWDGSGYPEGLKGREISLAARIMAVADVYDALRTKRVYKPAFSQEETCRIILEGSGKHFDPIIIEAFQNLKDRFNEIQTELIDAN